MVFLCKHSPSFMTIVHGLQLLSCLLLAILQVSTVEKEEVHLLAKQASTLLVSCEQRPKLVRLRQFGQIQFVAVPHRTFSYTHLHLVTKHDWVKATRVLGKCPRPLHTKSRNFTVGRLSRILDVTSA